MQLGVVYLHLNPFPSTGSDIYICQSVFLISTGSLIEHMEKVGIELSTKFTSYNFPPWVSKIVVLTSLLSILSTMGKQS
jgi:hypothetical protein